MKLSNYSTPLAALFALASMHVRAQHNVIVNGIIQDAPGIPLMVRIGILDNLTLVSLEDSVMSTPDGQFAFDIFSPFASGLAMIPNACQPNFSAGWITFPVNEDVVLDTVMPCPSSFPCTIEYVVFPTLDGAFEPIPFMADIQPYIYGGLGPFSFSWDFGDGNTSDIPTPIHPYPSSGPYVLCLNVTDGVDCNSTFCDTLTVDPDGVIQRNGFTVIGLPAIHSPLSISESVASPNGLVIAPNPGTGTRWCTATNLKPGNYSLVLLDPSGRIVHTERMMLPSSGNFTLNPPALAQGHYVLELSGQGASMRTKLIVH